MTSVENSSSSQWRQLHVVLPRKPEGYIETRRVPPYITGLVLLWYAFSVGKLRGWFDRATAGEVCGLVIETKLQRRINH